ncbi:Uncharacterized protein GBIM_05055 [Gryllus bimaculatus]|nr:Uncharacterized protein GBIM_05055 [Gryllus bimaculatus]
MSETPVTFNQLLIAMVRERPPLWDVRNPAYRDKTIKNKLWAEIGGIMQKNEWCSSEDDLRAKWKHLRDRYTKCVKDDNGSNQHVIGKKAPWPLLPYLDFLRDSVTHRSARRGGREVEAQAAAEEQEEKKKKKKKKAEDKWEAKAWEEEAAEEEKAEVKWEAEAAEKKKMAEEKCRGNREEGGSEVGSRGGGEEVKWEAEVAEE